MAKGALQGLKDCVTRLTEPVYRMKNPAAPLIVWEVTPNSQLKGKTVTGLRCAKAQWKLEKLFRYGDYRQTVD